jgi:hypothetical protein
MLLFRPARQPRVFNVDTGIKYIGGKSTSNAAVFLGPLLGRQCAGLLL